MSYYLTKSNFRLGLECKQKLKYYKLNYPSTLEEDPMPKFFADGGFMVEAIAHAVMREANPNVEFEFSLKQDRYQARVDAWEMFDEQIILTEIKSSSVESGDQRQFFTQKGEVESTSRLSLLDITFQVMVARLIFPDHKILPRLCVVNRTKRSNLEAIYAKIDFLDVDGADQNKPRAVFSGDSRALTADHFLEFIDVNDVVSKLMDEVVQKSQDLIDFLDGKQNYTPLIAPKPCKKCEYRGAALLPNGFDECWGLPRVEPHFIDLYQGYQSKEQKEVVELKMSKRDFHLANLPAEAYDTGKSYAAPRRNQVQVARSGKEFQDPQLIEKLRGLTFPLHFIDFEASRIPVPYLPGMKPYEQVAFQFSCHTVHSPDSDELKHTEWLNLRDVYPNEEFIAELRKAIGDTGTVLVWSHYEASTLKSVRQQLIELDKADNSLLMWFQGLVGAIGDKNAQTRIVDMLKYSQEFYCHPSMNGSHSIKRVLDAIWSGASFLWSDPWFSKYYLADAENSPIDPYKTLGEGSQSLGLDETADEEGADIPGVTDGVGAMRAYQSLLYGLRRGDENYQNQLIDAMYKYCALDTAAMVMIWRYWLTPRN